MGHTSPVMEQPSGGGSELVQQVPVGMQVPDAGHPTCPAGQVPVEHALLAHVPLGQTIPQPPQLFGSLVVFAQ